MWEADLATSITGKRKQKQKNKHKILKTPLINKEAAYHQPDGDQLKIQVLI